jgi:multicomponent Na+:H+ antiporter subunit E
MDVFLKWKIVRIILTTSYLMVGWILFTGTFALFSLLLGLIFSLCIALLTYNIFIEEKEVARRTLLPRIYLLFIYIGVLVFKIYLASFKMALAIITTNINPRIVHFRTRLKSELARVILANSITLTPGTLTLDLDEDHLIVHWLNAKTTHSHYAGRLIKGHFESWLRRIWM